MEFVCIAETGIRFPRLNKRFLCVIDHEPYGKSMKRISHCFCGKAYPLYTHANLLTAVLEVTRSIE